METEELEAVGADPAGSAPIGGRPSFPPLTNNRRRVCEHKVMVCAAFAFSVVGVMITGSLFRLGPTALVMRRIAEERPKGGAETCRGVTSYAVEDSVTDTRAAAAAGGRREAR